MSDVVRKLARESAGKAVANDSQNESQINSEGLAAQVAYVVRAVGKRHARRYLRETTDFDILPTPEMFGI